MDKNNIKNFSVNAHRKLTEDIEYKMSLLGKTL